VCKCVKVEGLPLEAGVLAPTGLCTSSQLLDLESTNSPLMSSFTVGCAAQQQASIMITLSHHQLRLHAG
jgi:hypothetical protein